MTNAAKKMEMASEEKAIREAIATWAKAAFSKDLESVMALYADDVRAFDLPTPLQFKGKPAYKAHWEKCMEMCPAAGDSQALEVELDVDGELAFSSSIIHFTFPNEQGEKQDTYVRLTQGWRKQGGKWLIKHEHCSAPMDMESHKIVFDAKP